jgi:peptidoglycan hydrolase-like protein with peptidoglycan-binding domain
MGTTTDSDWRRQSGQPVYDTLDLSAAGRRRVRGDRSHLADLAHGDPGPEEGNNSTLGPHPVRVDAPQAEPVPEGHSVRLRRLTPLVKCEQMDGVPRVRTRACVPMLRKGTFKNGHSGSAGERRCTQPPGDPSWLPVPRRIRMAILKRGLAGEPVRRLQQKLGIEVDGEFGPKTEEALKAYQLQHGLTVDGIAGPDTFAQMGLHELILLKVGTSGDAVKKLQQALGVAADGQFGPGTERAVREYQRKNRLAVDGVAGPETLARMALFKEITPEKVALSQVPAAGPAGSATAEAPPATPTRRSIWDTVKSFFS